MQNDMSNGLTEGVPKRQIVLYALVGLVGIVLFGFLLRFAKTDTVSDTASTTISVATTSVAQPVSATGSAPIPPFTPAIEAFSFEIVATPALRQKGLSGRASVAQNYGMLFVFPAKDRYGFWMKDMRVPIDMIWLSDTGDGTATIAGIDARVSPDTYPATFTAPVPVRYVLETRTGEAERLGWKVGTRLTLPTGIPVPQ